MPPAERREDGELQLVPVTWSDAILFLKSWHRHHPEIVGHKFCIGVAAGEVLIGVAFVGRPVASAYQDGRTLEVNRSCTDGYPNANSMLYGACARAAWALGYRRLVTYTQEGESGSSLRGAGWKVIAQRPARKGWDSPSRPREGHGVDLMPRTLWEAVSA